MARNVVLYQLLSLDGVAEEPSDWMSDDGREIFENLGGVIASQDDVLLGRGTYDYWAGYWPTSDVEPFASFINGTPKHVFTSSDLADGDVLDRLEPADSDRTPKGTLLLHYRRAS